MSTTGIRERRDGVAPGQRIGLALGSGSARGWAHIGVINALAKMGIRPHVVAGASVGAIVGAIHALDRLAGFEEWVRGLGRREIMGLLDVSFSGSGFFEGKGLAQAFHQHFGDPGFDDLQRPFAAVATDLATGQEIWLREGSVAEAVRASISLPGLFTPVPWQGRWLVDGGLVNPVPISLCRAMGADLVIAVSLNGDLVGRRIRNRTRADREPSDPGWFDRLAGSVRDKAPWLGLLKRQSDNGPSLPGVFESITGSVNIMQDRITRSRMAGDPPDVLLAPRLARIGLLEFDRGAEAIAEGEAVVRRMAPAIRELFSDG